ncbi:MAG: tetratricopeptide repeat protein [Desulfobacteraceae bacterium]|jgi:tetratricopeptide (TPR) repeat protein
MVGNVHRPKHHPDIIISLFLVATILVVFWQVQNHEFLNLDDDLYITENRIVRRGLTWEGLIWAFSTSDISYWHPVTWLSHMVDCQLYGSNPRGHHFNSLLLHAANALLLFLALRRLTGARWRSAAVAAMFALHPLNIESVAWAADRKNVLSTFFWMLTVWSYAYYAESPGWKRYLIVFTCLAVGLMAKPMLVSLPFVLLLLDYWPLGRLRFGEAGGRSNITNQKSRGSTFQRAGLRLILEKIPLLVLSVASICLSSLSAKEQGILLPTRVVPAGLRIENALVSYLIYMKKMIWPIDLAVFYPYPEFVPFWAVAGAAFLLAGITLLGIRVRRQMPYLAVGWLWYIGTLLPVIGLVQQGLWPAMADRFAYIPLIGLFIMVVWGFAPLAAKWPFQRILPAICPGILLLWFTMVSWVQLGHWKNSATLFERALDVTSNNFLAHMNLGSALANLGREKRAIIHFNKALETGYPRPEQVHFNLGKALSSLSHRDEAILQHRQALKIAPNYIDPHISLGSISLRSGEWDKALYHFYRVLEIDKENTKAHNNIGVVMLHQGKLDEALTHLRAALQIDPHYEVARKNLAIALSRKGSPLPEQVR